MRDAYDLDLSSIRHKVDLECTCTGVAVAAIAKGKREWVGGAFSLGTRQQSASGGGRYCQHQQALY